MSINKTISLGEQQTLLVVKTTDFGVYLATEEGSNDKVLLPKSQVPEHTKVGDTISVFIYKDSEDRLIATRMTPTLVMGQVNKLNVKEVGTIGAFLDWGLAKDLFLPFKEQTDKVRQGEQALVTLYIDKSNRLCATMKVYEYLSTDSPYKRDDKVSGMVYEISDQFGAFVAVDEKYSGLITRQQLFEPVRVGQIIEARVSNVREDGKLDLSLREKTHIQMDDDATLIYNSLTANNGFIPFNDKSAPEAIKKEFNLSKNAFKRALGRLMKENKIRQDEKGSYKL
ncbi:MAG: S1-like domain-containing RNA-binding protein [bacterium]|nr:S1-like domain-containing RNA-binding protein [bacterium]